MSFTNNNNQGNSPPSPLPEGYEKTAELLRKLTPMYKDVQKKEQLKETVLNNFVRDQKDVAKLAQGPYENFNHNVARYLHESEDIDQSMKNVIAPMFNELGALETFQTILKKTKPKKFLFIKNYSSKGFNMSYKHPVEWVLLVSAWVDYKRMNEPKKYAWYIQRFDELCNSFNPNSSFIPSYGGSGSSSYNSSPYNTYGGNTSYPSGSSLPYGSGPNMNKISSNSPSTPPANQSDPQNSKKTLGASVPSSSPKVSRAPFGVIPPKDVSIDHEKMIAFITTQDALTGDVWRRFNFQSSNKMKSKTFIDECSEIYSVIYDTSKEEGLNYFDRIARLTDDGGDLYDLREILKERPLAWLHACAAYVHYKGTVSEERFDQKAFNKNWSHFRALEGIFADIEDNYPAQYEFEFVFDENWKTQSPGQPSVPQTLHDFVARSGEWEKDRITIRDLMRDVAQSLYNNDSELYTAAKESILKRGGSYDIDGWLDRIKAAYAGSEEELQNVYGEHIRSFVDLCWIYVFQNQHAIERAMAIYNYRKLLNNVYLTANMAKPQGYDDADVLLAREKPVIYVKSSQPSGRDIKLMENFINFTGIFTGDDERRKDLFFAVIGDLEGTTADNAIDRIVQFYPKEMDAEAIVTSLIERYRLHANDMNLFWISVERTLLDTPVAWVQIAYDYAVKSKDSDSLSPWLTQFDQLNGQMDWKLLGSDASAA